MKKMNSKTTLTINKELNIDLLIVAKLSGKTKEELAEELLTSGLRPLLDKIKRDRFS